jgi:hypothetical protein
MEGYPKYTRFYNYPKLEVRTTKEPGGTKIQIAISNNSKMMSDSPVYQKYSQFLTGSYKRVRLISNNWWET